MENNEPYVPEPAISRLPWYLACVSRLRAQGVEYVSTTAISQELNVESSQIAKDLSYLSIKGKTRIGYEVKELERGLYDFLGFRREHKAVMMGVGSLGSALIADSGLSRVGRSLNGKPIYPLSELSRRVGELGAEIAVIAVPVESCAEVAELCVAAGIKALWNFTPFRIRTAPDVVVQNTSIYAHLAVMYNRMPRHKD